MYKQEKSNTNLFSLIWRVSGIGLTFWSFTPKIGGFKSPTRHHKSLVGPFEGKRSWRVQRDYNIRMTNSEELNRHLVSEASCKRNSLLYRG